AAVAVAQRRTPPPAGQQLRTFPTQAIARMASLRALLRQVLHLQESPHRTALAFAIGSALAFCPFYGFHMALVGLCTWAFKLNFIALLAGALINNPWTIMPILGATYWT